MKLTNAQLAFALARRYSTALPTALAQSICDRPNSRRFNAVAEKILELRDIPDEAWAAPVPEKAEGEHNLKLAITRLNEEYQNQPASSLHSIVALRRLAWHASQLARRLEHEDSRAFHEAVMLNGGHTANLFHEPVYAPLTPASIKEYGERVKLDSADGRNAVLVDAVALNGAQPPPPERNHHE